MKTIVSLLIFALLILALAIATVHAQQTQTATFSLKWNPPSVLPDGSNAPTGIKIERRTGTGVYAEIAQLGVVTAYKDVIPNSVGGTQHCYRVRWFNAVGNSPYSNEACGTTSTIQVVPGTPSGVEVIVTIEVKVP